MWQAVRRTELQLIRSKCHRADKINRTAGTHISTAPTGPTPSRPQTYSIHPAGLQINLIRSLAATMEWALAQELEPAWGLTVVWALVVGTRNLQMAMHTLLLLIWWVRLMDPDADRALALGRSLGVCRGWVLMRLVLVLERVEDVGTRVCVASGRAQRRRREIDDRFITLTITIEDHGDFLLGYSVRSHGGDDGMIRPFYVEQADKGRHQASDGEISLLGI